MRDARTRQARYRASHKVEIAARQLEWRVKTGIHGKRIIGIDGEGLTIGNQHLYCYMAAWDADRQFGEVENQKGLTTQQCLDLILSLPQDALIVGFSLGYDYTKMLEDLPNKTLYELTRPESRMGLHGAYPRYWGDYKLNYVKGRFSVAKVQRGAHSRKCLELQHKPISAGTNRRNCKGCFVLRRAIVWDIFAFFQASFIKACKLWGVVTNEEYEELRAMKEKRGDFTWDQWEAVKTYCGLECRKLSSLCQRLTEAHNDAGLKLRSYFGAGSTAARMLTVKFNAKAFKAATIPEMRLAVACSFFGGRFEISRLGPVRQRIYTYDIASAYPYHYTFLPCLAHGQWRLVQGKGLIQEIERAATALIRYRLPQCDSINVNHSRGSSFLGDTAAPWGPFPFRTHKLSSFGGPDDGNIIFPSTSGGGWVWKEEFLAGLRNWPNVVAEKAWIFEPGCDDVPFNGSAPSTMPEQYCLRLAWGKEGRGIVVKLGCNSCYGKCAQSTGNNPPFQCFIWASMITSGCRAQLLEAIACARNRESILMTATDGIFSTEPLQLPDPRDTSTREAAQMATLKDGKKKHPLGAWEPKELENGIMLVRPGIAFPLDKDLDVDVIKARGIGKSVFHKYRAAVLDAYEKDGPKPFTIERPMFYGMKSSMDYSESRGHTRRELYGKWEQSQKQEVTYHPFPKRPFVNEDRTMPTWCLGANHVSSAYTDIISAEAKALKVQAMLEAEQPDREDAEDDFRD